MKTPDITLSSNSIGARVNVQCPKPVDRPGRGAHTAYVHDEAQRLWAVTRGEVEVPLTVLDVRSAAPEERETVVKSARLAAVETP